MYVYIYENDKQRKQTKKEKKEQNKEKLFKKACDTYFLKKKKTRRINKLVSDIEISLKKKEKASLWS